MMDEKLLRIKRYLMDLPPQNGGQLVKLLFSSGEKNTFVNLLSEVFNMGPVKSHEIVNQVLNIVTVNSDEIDPGSKSYVIKKIIECLKSIIQGP